MSPDVGYSAASNDKQHTISVNFDGGFGVIRWLYSADTWIIMKDNREKRYDATIHFAYMGKKRIPRITPAKMGGQMRNQEERILFTNAFQAMN